MLPSIEYIRAEGIAHALEVLGRHGTNARVLAGGTDLLVDMRDRRQDLSLLVDVSQVRELAFVSDDPASIHIGSGLTVSQLRANRIIAQELPALAEAGRSFADYLTQNKATVGGNLANGSPGADLAVPLLALGASVVLASVRGERTVALAQFLLGPRRTALASDELLTEIVVPRPAPRGQSFAKLGLKQAGTIAVVSAAVLMDVAGARYVNVRIGLGAVAPQPFRSTAAEECLEGREYSPERVGQAAQAAIDSAQPISDVRGSAEYRRAMVGVLVRRGIEAAHANASIPTGDSRRDADRPAEGRTP